MKIIKLLIFLCLPLPLFAESVRVQVIDVGQADGIIIRSPSKNHWIVIDAGTNKNIAQYLTKMGVNKIDLAVVTHRHHDHQGGMDNVINTTPVDFFVGITDDCPKRVSDDNVRTAIQQNNITVQPLSDSPQTITIGNLAFTIFPLPKRATCPQHENLNSIVIRMDYGEFSMLFTGDAEEKSLQWLTSNYPELLDVDVLKASHHGSNNGQTANFLSAVTPERVVISAGVNAKYKHPMEEAVTNYLAASSNRVYCTNRHGSIRVYGYETGNIRIYKQKRNNKSCVYDGIHY